MIIGNIVLTRESVDKEIALLKRKNFKKISNYLNVYRFSIEAEDFLVAHPDELWEILLLYLKTYKYFAKEYSIAALLYRLFEIYAYRNDSNDFENYRYILEYHKSVVKMVGVLEKFGDLLLTRDIKVLNCYIKKVSAKNVVLTDNVFKIFVNFGDIPTIMKYLSAHSISKSSKSYLAKLKQWELLNACSDICPDLEFNSEDDLAEYYEYNMVNNQWDIFKKLTAAFNVPTKTATALFRPENASFFHMYIDCTRKKRFGNGDIEFKFLMMFEQYWNEISSYVKKYASEMELSKANEAILFKEENIKLLLLYASCTRFRFKCYEIRFLKMMREYPGYVSNYVRCYRGAFSFTDAEEKDLLTIGDEMQILLKESYPQAVSKVIVPSLCRYRHQTDTYSVPCLIDLSLTNPQPLRDWIACYGPLSEEDAVRLFFYGGEDVLYDYAKSHSFNLSLMVDYLKKTDVSKTAEALWKVILDTKKCYKNGVLAFIDVENFGCFAGNYLYPFYFVASNDKVNILHQILNNGEWCGRKVINNQESRSASLKTLVDLCFAVARQNRLTA